MIEPKTATEDMMYCTSRVVGFNSNGDEFKTGTGFFYQFPISDGDDRNIPLLVTNKHVVDGVAQAEFLIHTIEGIARDVERLARQARAAGFSVTAYILEMAVEEARKEARTVKAHRRT
jgi:hypothetical protein